MKSVSPQSQRVLDKALGAFTAPLGRDVLLTPNPSPWLALQASKRSAQREDRSFSIPSSPPRLHVAALLQKRQRSFVPYRSPRPKARTRRESRRFARDG